MKIFKKIVITLVVLIVLTSGAGFYYIYSKLNSIYVEDEVEQDDVVESQQENEGNIVDGVTNVLLVGTDGRRDDKGNRSDGMMIATMNHNTKQIKLSSIARDTYVEIPGYGKEKMTHAYAYEGIDLLKEVFKVNFDIDIDKYVVVNFVSFIDVIDEIGGVVVDVTENDLKVINGTIDDCYSYVESRETKPPKEYINEAGEQRLNGYQALAFSRIRKHDSAYDRDGRHREVAESVYKEFMESGMDEFKNSIDIILENTRTNISPMEMLDLGFTAFEIGDTEIDQFQFPLEEHRNGHIVSDSAGWVIEWDKEPNLEAWHNFIYN